MFAVELTHELPCKDLSACPDCEEADGEQVLDSEHRNDEQHPNGLLAAEEVGLRSHGCVH